MPTTIPTNAQLHAESGPARNAANASPSQYVRVDAVDGSRPSSTVPQPLRGAPSNAATTALRMLAFSQRERSILSRVVMDVVMDEAERNHSGASLCGSHVREGVCLLAKSVPVCTPKSNAQCLIVGRYLAAQLRQLMREANATGRGVSSRATSRSLAEGRSYRRFLVTA